MKALDSFTVERLEEIIRSRDFYCHEDTVALARIALAAKRAEPDSYFVITSAGVWQARYKTRYDAENHIKPWHRGYWIKEIYTTPQLNSPEIPDGWTSSGPANAALVMLDRIDTIDSADDDRIEDIKLIIRQLADAPDGNNKR
ncbi:hypothetical protein [Yersinia alsatica]|uniref:hypothetical protein n=1 Tax=Yersinia alsatica TaxID=2890317 RepID=UPI0011A5B3A9|nr:hypothetical protein [Yersinia alsatica]